MLLHGVYKNGVFFEHFSRLVQDFSQKVKSKNGLSEFDACATSEILILKKISKFQIKIITKQTPLIMRLMNPLVNIV